MKHKQGLIGQNRDLTRGSIGKALILFSLPLLAASLIQQLYNTVDLIFVGRLLGTRAAAAVGASSMLVTCTIGFFTGMSVGSGVLAGRCFGAGNWRGLGKTIETAMAMTFSGGLLLMVLGILLSPSILNLMNTPPDILADATAYIRIYFVSAVPIIGYNIGSGIIRALGDSRSPLFYQLLGGLMNVAANWFFIVYLDWGVKGAAVATMFSQSLAFVLVFIHLMRLDKDFRLRPSKIRFHQEELGAILQVGIPAGLQAMATTFSNLFIQSRINTLGVDAIAAFTAYYKVELFIYLPIMAFSQGATTFTSQNYGAGAYDRVRKGTRQGLLIGLGFTIGLSALMIIISSQAFGLFTKDPAVIVIGTELAAIAFPFYFLYVILEVLGATIRGTGKALPPMIIILFNMCGVRLILLAIFMNLYATAGSIALVYPLTWLVTTICMGLYYRFGNWLPQEALEGGV